MIPMPPIEPTPHIPSPPPPPLTVRLIERHTDLVALAPLLARDARIAVDSESDSFHHYTEKVCLLQISTQRETVLLDPLQLDNLSPLLPIFANPMIEKVLHGADYDVRTLARDYGVAFDPLFDTMVAAQILGLPEWGLAALLKRYFGVILNKKFQKADWSRRPIAEEMIRYAAEDTAYLLPLRDILGEELTRQGRLEWLREECRLLVDNRTGPRPPPSCFNIKGAGRLEPKQQAVLQALLEFREAAARDTDRPPFKIVANEILLELAAQQPTLPDELSHLRGLTPHVLGRYGAGLLTAIRTGQAVPPEQWPKRRPFTHSPIDPKQEARLKRLKAARDRHAVSLGLSPGFLCSNAVMERLVRLDAPTADAVAPQLTRWRFSILGNDFLAILGPTVGR